MEYEPLKLLMGFPDRVYTREEILALVLGLRLFGGMRTVDVHVRRVRAEARQDHAYDRDRPRRRLPPGRGPHVARHAPRRVR
jgi:DNA-binding response OmpR family regulator